MVDRFEQEERYGPDSTEQGLIKQLNHIDQQKFLQNLVLNHIRGLKS